MQFSDKNIYEMSVANGSVGFWVRRTTWASTVAQIVAIGKFTKPAPYYGSPSVLMDVYSLEGVLREPLATTPVPGTYKTWRLIEPPSWAASVKSRDASDPALVDALAKLDRKRGKNSVDTKTQVVLSVPFERKDEAKQIGARWSAVDKKWWLPASDLKGLAKSIELGFLDQMQEVDKN